MRSSLEVSRDTESFVFEILIEGGYENLKIAFYYETHFVPSSNPITVSFTTLIHTIISNGSRMY